MRIGIGFVLLFAFSHVTAESPQADTNPLPHVAIVIDDLGDRLHEGQRSVNLPGPVTIGIIPYTPYAKRLALAAGEAGKEVLLHLPMEAMSQRYLGKGGLSSTMDKQQFFSTLNHSLRYLSNIRGVSNHMGSLLTQNRERMTWLMAGLKKNGGLYFLDSRTIDTSLAMEVAEQNGVEHATRDVFLDHHRSEAKMNRQWAYFIKLAKQKGSAVCIAHPYSESLAFLKQKLSTLDAEGVRLVSVSELINWREHKGGKLWQTSMSSSP